MPLPKVFVEGDTEKNVVIYIIENVLGIEIPDKSKDEWKRWQQNLRKMKSGKDAIAGHIRKLGPDIGITPIRCLVMRDLDSHEEETPDSIIQSVENVIQGMLEERGYAKTVKFSSYELSKNVFTWEADDPRVRFALHIASPEEFDWSQGWRFIKTTTDDYILSLALKSHSTRNLLDGIGLNDVDSDAVVRKVQEEIPALLCKNGIQLREAKDYVRIYLAVMRLGMSPAVFAGKLLSHADRAEIEQVFATLIAALRFVMEETE